MIAIKFEEYTKKIVEKLTQNVDGINNFTAVTSYIFVGYKWLDVFCFMIWLKQTQWTFYWLCD